MVTVIQSLSSLSLSSSSHRCRLEPRTNFFRLRNRQKIVRIRFENIRYLLTYSLTRWSRVLLEKLTGFQLVKKFPAFYGTRGLITAFTSARHLSLSWGSSIQSITSLPTSWRSILILSSHLHLGLPSGPFPSGFPTKTLYTPLISPICATCRPSIFSRFYRPNNIVWGVLIIKLLII